MIKLTQQQFDNCKKGLEILREAPEVQFDLQNYKQTTVCGTLFCSLGWLTESKAFESQGLCWSTVIEQGFNGPRQFPTLAGRENEYEVDDVAGALFGPASWDYLFAARINGAYDHPLLLARARQTDKQLAILRFEKWIADATVED